MLYDSVAPPAVPFLLCGMAFLWRRDVVAPSWTNGSDEAVVGLRTDSSLGRAGRDTGSDQQTPVGIMCLFGELFSKLSRS